MDANLDKKLRITILTPVFNEEECLHLYEKEIRNVLFSHKDYIFNVLFIDDGSSDQSWNIINQICEKDSRFAAIRLSRNFGSHVALSAGFASVKSDAAATLACDLQDPPEVILEFLSKWRKGAQIVWGHRQNREDETWRILTSNTFSRLLKRFAMPDKSKFTTGSFFLADRKVVESFCEFKEHNRITFALVAWTGFEQEVVKYDRKKRVAGCSGWNFHKMIKTLYDAFIGFSFLPIRLMTLLGVTVFCLAVLLLIYLVVEWLIGNPVIGWTGIMFAITFFFGLQFLLMGISGEYLFRIYSEVVRRPLYFISETVNMHNKPGSHNGK